MDNKNKSIVPIDPSAYNQVGATLKQDSNINSDIVDQVNNNSIPEIPMYEIDTSIGDFDSQNMLGGDYYNLRKSSSNQISIVNQYNHIDTNNIVDEHSVSSYEEQLNNSKDLVFYKQQPKAPEDLPQPVIQPIINQTMEQPVMNQQVTQPVMNQQVTQPVINQPMVQPVISQQTNPYPQYDPYNNYNNGYNMTNNYQQNPGYPNAQQQPIIQPVQQTQMAQIQSIPGSRNDNSIHTKHRETIGVEGFNKKMKTNVRKFNFLLAGIYILIFSVITYFGYNLWIEQHDFYFSKSKINLALGSSYEEKIYIRGNLDKNNNYTWISKDESIVKVNEDGTITSVKDGTADIEVTNKKTKKKKTITVKVIDVQISQFAIEPNEKVVHIKNTYTIVPLINEQSSLVMDLEWSNSNAEVASVSENGLVTPKKPGRTTITVSVPNTKFRDSITIIVVDKK